MRSYKKIIFTTSSETAAGILLAQLEDEGFYAFETEDNELTGYIETSAFDEDKLRSSLNDDIHFQIETIPDQNWNEEWEKSFSPVVIDDIAVIRADFHQPVAGIQYEIVITPKMSFGTGHHATTHLMVSSMNQLDFTKKNVIDFGMGTGILAILAEKMGAEKIVAIDNDPQSIENAKENITTNHCSHINIIEASNLHEARPADIILANINKNILLQHAVALADHAGHGGTLIISGFLDIDCDTMVTSFEQAGFVLISQKSMGEWMAITLQKA